MALARRFPLLVVVLLLFVASVAAAQRVATVKHRDSKGRERDEKDVHVVEHTYAGLKVKFSGTGRPDRVFSDDEIVSVIYNREPDGYKAAIKDYKEGVFEEALDDFAALLADDRAIKRDPWIVQDALYYSYESARRLRRMDEAKGFADRLLKDEPKSRWIPALKLRHAADLLAQEKFTEAVAAFKAVRQQAETGGWAKSYVIRAGLGEAEALSLMNKVGDAATLTQQMKAAADAAEFEALKQRVQVMEALLLLRQQKPAEAKGAFERLLGVAKNEDTVLRAGAANGRGDSRFEQNDFENAMYDYSMTAALYYDVPDLESEVGWALWMWGSCCKRLSNAIANNEDETKKTYARRYRALLKRAAEEFPLTRGGRLSLLELGQ